MSGIRTKLQVGTVSEYLLARPQPPTFELSQFNSRNNLIRTLK